jgi:adenosylhomocysteine nucleosidase
MKHFFLPGATQFGESQPWTALVMEPPASERLVIALVGLSFEARIAEGPGVCVICRDTESEISTVLDGALERGCRSIISFGVAGGLAPHLRAGDWVVASSVIDANDVRPTDQSWSKRILDMIPGAAHAPIVGVDSAMTETATKRQTHAKTGAAAVDMESHLVARLAAAHGLSFAAARVVIDPAHRSVPAAALAGMRPDGGTSITGVMRGLMARPSELLGLMRLGLDAYVARNALLRMRSVLGPSFGCFGAVPL